MNRKITVEQALHITQLVTQQHLKLREVQEQFPVLSLTQLHRIAVGKNWDRITGATGRRMERELVKENG